MRENYSMDVHKVKYIFVSQLTLLHRISLGMDNSLISIRDCSFVSGSYRNSHASCIFPRIS